jgi:hypothetical protein
MAAAVIPPGGTAGVVSTGAGSTAAEATTAGAGTGAATGTGVGTGTGAPTTAVGAITAGTYAGAAG